MVRATRRWDEFRAYGAKGGRSRDGAISVATPALCTKRKKKNVYIRFCCLFCRKSQLLELTTLSRSEYRYLCRGEGGPFRRVPLYLCKNVSSRKPRPVANFAASSIAGVSPSPLLKQVFLRCVLHIYKASIDRSWDERASFDDGAFVGQRQTHRSPLFSHRSEIPSSKPSIGVRSNERKAASLLARHSFGVLDSLE